MAAGKIALVSLNFLLLEVLDGKRRSDQNPHSLPRFGASITLTANRGGAGRG